MPLSGGTAGAHDDSMHQGSAKKSVDSGVASLDTAGRVIDKLGQRCEMRYDRDLANGYAGLDAAGALLVPGSKIYYTRDGSDDVHIYERTSDEEAYAFHRVGANDYTLHVKESNVWERAQTESMKDVVSGIAALDANGHVLAPGYRFTAARGAAEQITIRERTSDERAFRWIRIGANDYEARVNVGGVEKVVQHEGMKDVASGIPGLDASVKSLWEQLPLPMLTVAQFQANAATGTADTPAEINDNDTSSITYADAIGEYFEILFDHPMFIKEYRHYGNIGNNGDGVWKIQIKQDGAWVDNTIAIACRTTADWTSWISLTFPAYTQGLRFVATTIDTSMNSTFTTQLEVRG